MMIDYYVKMRPSVGEYTIRVFLGDVKDACVAVWSKNLATDGDKFLCICC